MQDWESLPKEWAHIGLPERKEKTLVGFFDTYVKPNINLNGQRILDYGCGGGYFAEWVQGNYECEYHGFDISKRSIKAASEKVTGNYYNDLLRVPKVDVIVCLAVIQHCYLHQVMDIQEFMSKSGAKKLFIQYRYSPYEIIKGNTLTRYSCPFFEVPNYKTEWKSEILPNGYRYERQGISI